MDPDGQRSLRVEQVPGLVEGPRVDEVELGAWARGALVQTWTEPVSEAAWRRVAEEPQIPREAWPARFTVGIAAWDGLPDDERERSERRLVEAVTPVVQARGGQVVWLSPLAREALDAERRRQYSGRVADREQVALGREAGATVLVRPVARRAESLWQIGVDVPAVESGAVWATVSWEVPANAVPSATEAVTARVVRLFRQAPGRELKPEP